MSLPEDFSRLLPKLAAEREEGPLYFLWVFNPDNDEVTVEHNEGRHPATHVDHGHLAERISSPERIHGFAYKIRGGWRVMTWEHQPVDDPHILKQVKLALAGHRAAPRKTSQVQSRALR